MLRRILNAGAALGALACLLAVAGAPAAAKQAVTVTDISGRNVTVELPIRRMILGEGRFLPTLAILDPDDPVRWVAGMMGDFKRYDAGTYARYTERFPALSGVPLIGQDGAESFSLERAISLSPDVAVFGLGSGHGPGARHKDVLDRLATAGVPVVIVDFRIDPLGNTPKSMTLLGRLMGREAQAAAFLDFYRAQMGLVQEALRGVDDRPSVFMELHVGLRDQCCAAVGRGMMGQFIEWAGGRNLFGEKIPGTHGAVSLEYLLVNQPDIYIGTAIGSPATAAAFPQRIVLGTGVAAPLAEASLARSTERTGIGELTAIGSGRAHAIWHHFYNTPFHVAAVQAMAKWLHPKRFRDLSPEDTLDVLYDRFQPFPLDGVYWTSLPSPQHGTR